MESSKVCRIDGLRNGKCRKFDLITDNRFGENEAKLNFLVTKLKKTGILILSESKTRELNFIDALGAEPASKQWRKTFIVCRKQGETWNDVIAKINTVQPNPLDIVNCP